MLQTSLIFIIRGHSGRTAHLFLTSYWCGKKGRGSSNGIKNVVVVLLTSQCFWALHSSSVWLARHACFLQKILCYTCALVPDRRIAHTWNNFGGSCCEDTRKQLLHSRYVQLKLERLKWRRRPLLSWFRTQYFKCHLGSTNISAAAQWVDYFLRTFFNLYFLCTLIFFFITNYYIDIY